MTDILPATARLAPRPALVLAVDRLRAAGRGDRLALDGLRAHLQSLSFVDARCASLVTRTAGATALRPGVVQALEDYRGTTAAQADAWLNGHAQRAAGGR